MTPVKQTEFIVGYCYGLLCREFNHVYAISRTETAESIAACIDVPRTWFPNNRDIVDTVKYLILVNFEGQYKDLKLDIKTTQIKQYIRFTLVGHKLHKLTKSQIEAILGYKIDIVED